jgi:DNA polymerase III epsilon subunit-like protein
MAILLSFDVESTGLNVHTDRVIEVGAILYSTGQKKCLESAGYLVKSDVPVSEEITKLTGISQAAVNKFGYESEDALETVLQMASLSDAFIGQNVLRFDKRVLEEWAKRHGKTVPEKLWIDTRTDLPGIEGKHLGYMAADAGFLNMFPHSALSDCQTVLKLVEPLDINAVIERAKSPLLILRAHVSFQENQLAKKRKYTWFPAKKYWVKVIKQQDLEVETSHKEFDVTFLDDITAEEIWYS